MRDHPYGWSILVINTFAGWTLLGWVVSLAWAVCPIQRPARPIRAALPAPPAPVIVTSKPHVTATDKLFQLKYPAPYNRWEELDK
jgi:hypothetical protein